MIIEVDDNISWARRKQDETWGHAKSKIVRWDSSEDETLIRLLGTMTQPQIALLLGRTYRSVATRVYFLRKEGAL